MKILTLIYDAAVDQSVMGLLEELEVKTWTKSYGLQGEGLSGLKVNTPVWPGINNHLVVAGEEARLREVAEQVRALQAEFKLRPGIFMYLQDAEEL